MRRILLAAALAVVSLPATAAAQPDAPALLRAVLEQIAAEEPRGARDYSFTFVPGAVRTPVYVYREDAEWGGDPLHAAGDGRAPDGGERAPEPWTPVVGR